jgi:hypothetical protein
VKRRRIASERPELGLAPRDAPIGLTYDVSPVLTRGGRGVTFVVASGHGEADNGRVVVELAVAGLEYRGVHPSNGVGRSTTLGA